jgi:hypothetical protein
MRRDPQGVTLPEDSVRREANHADNKMRHAWKHRRRLRSTARAVVRARGEETPSELEPSGDEEEEEREVISSPPKILPSPGGLFVWQAGIPASACRVKCPGRMPMGCPAHRHSSGSHWYVLSYWECTFVFAGAQMTYLYGVL